VGSHPVFCPLGIAGFFFLSKVTRLERQVNDLATVQSSGCERAILFQVDRGFSDFFGLPTIK